MVGHRELLNAAYERGELPEVQLHYLRHFETAYVAEGMANGWSKEHLEPLLRTFLELILKQIREPYLFEPYHQAVKEPFNYYQFGIDFLRPLVKFDESGLIGQSALNSMLEQMHAGENVVLFANHQIEPDPQAISVILEKDYPLLAQDMVFVAGHRVTTDPMAAALTIGRNLLCIYSKKYIEHPPELRAEKIRHNQRTLKRMAGLFDEGGHCIYVAPSGGRDRPDERGILDVARFDPQNIGLFLLIASRSKRPVHFYPLALYSYELIPPPDKVEIPLGEFRSPRAAPVRLAFGAEFSQANLQAEAVWEEVRRLYRLLVGEERRPNTPLQPLKSS